MDDAARESGSGAGAALPKSLLVGTDGSPTALVAVRRAAMLAKALDCQLTVVCAQRREARGEGLWAGAVADTSSGASASA
ncbi:MAG: universal stress protein, partial [Mycobacterium sp.]